MKRFLVGGVLAMWLAMSPMTAEAAVIDWPIIGQAARVGICVLGGSGQLGASLVAHAAAYGKEVRGIVGECITKVINTPVALVTNVVSGAGVAPGEDVHTEEVHE